MQEQACGRNVIQMLRCTAQCTLTTALTTILICMTCISRVGVHGASQAASKKVLTAAIAHQSNPFANQVNILTVTVEANFDIPALSHLIVRNLRGIQERDGGTLAVSSSLATLVSQSALLHNRAARILITGQGLPVALPAGTNITVQLSATNGDIEQLNPPVMVVEVKHHDTLLAARDVSPVKQALFEVKGASTPLLILKPAISLAIASQATPFAALQNEICLQVRLNVPLYGSNGPLPTSTSTMNSRLQLTGLPSWLQRDFNFSPLTSTRSAHNVDLQAILTSAGMITFEIQNHTMLPDEVYALNLSFTNPSTAQSNPLPIVLEIAGSFQMQAAFQNCDRNVLGVSRGSTPGLVVVPAFRSIESWQTNPLAGALNYLHLRIQTNFHLTADSLVTIHGLTPLKDTLTLNSANIENFQGRSRWTTEGDAQLVLWMNASITERQFEVRMSARNPNTASAGANLTVEALAHFRARGVSPIAPRTAASRNYTVQGVHGGSIPLLIVVPAFDLSKSTIMMTESGRFDLSHNPIAINIGPATSSVSAFGDAFYEAKQLVTFVVSVVAEGSWNPIFSRGGAPQMSIRGELSFELAEQSAAAHIAEDKIAGFRLQILLQNNDGTKYGVRGTSEPQVLQFIIIGMPVAPQYAHAIAESPREAHVRWMIGAQSLSAFDLGTKAPGRIVYFQVVLQHASGHDGIRQEQTVLMPTNEFIFHELMVGEHYIASVAACNILACSEAQPSQVVVPLEIPSTPTNVKILRRSGTEVVISWDPLTDVGDGTAYSAATPSSQGVGEVGWQVSFLRDDMSAHDAPAIAEIQDSEWSEHVVITSQEWPQLFTIQDQLMLHVVFINRVGYSMEQVMEFNLKRIDCEDICGDNVQTASEDCDDGNLRDGDGCSRSCTIESMHFCSSTSTPNFVCGPYEGGNPHLPRLVGSSWCRMPAFVSLKVTGSTSLSGAKNTIFVSFQTNFDISAADAITVLGLKGYDTPTGVLAVRVLRDSEDSFTVSGRWDAEKGAVTVRVPTVSNAMSSFSFELTNPNTSQTSMSLQISCHHCCSNDGCRSLDVQHAQHANSSLGVTVIPPSCDQHGAFGRACEHVCVQGIVKGHFCHCLPNYFGFDCSVHAEPDPARSFMTVVTADSPVSVGSFSDSLHSPAVLPVTKVKLDIPAGALNETTLLRADVYGVRPFLEPGSSLTPIADIVQLSPDDIHLALPVVLSLSVDPESLDNTIAKEKTELHICYLNTASGKWTTVGNVNQSRVGDSVIITTTVDHFSLWSVFAVPLSLTSTTSKPAATSASGVSSSHAPANLDPTPQNGSKARLTLITGVAVGAFSALLLAVAVSMSLILLRRKHSLNKHGDCLYDSPQDDAREGCQQALNELRCDVILDEGQRNLVSVEAALASLSQGADGPLQMKAGSKRDDDNDVPRQERRRRAREQRLHRKKERLLALAVDDGNNASRALAAVAPPWHDQSSTGPQPESEDGMGENGKMDATTSAGMSKHPVPGFDLANQEDAQQVTIPFVVLVDLALARCFRLYLQICKHQLLFYCCRLCLFVCKLKDVASAQFQEWTRVMLSGRRDSRHRSTSSPPIMQIGQRESMQSR